MTAPLSEADLAVIQDAVNAYGGHPRAAFPCCSAHGAADTTAVLLAEVRRQRAEIHRLQGAVYAARAAAGVPQ